MKPLMVLPNFRIMVFLNQKGSEELVNKIKIHSESISVNNQSETFMLTASSYWKGLNTHQEQFDFIEILKNNSDEIPSNVLSELENWKNKFGVIDVLDNNSCIVNKPEILQGIINHNLIKDYIEKVQDNIVLFKNLNTEDFVKILENEFGHPVKISLQLKPKLATQDVYLSLQANLEKLVSLVRELEEIPEEEEEVEKEEK